jgi:hypothetical protein
VLEFTMCKLLTEIPAKTLRKLESTILAQVSA